MGCWHLERELVLHSFQQMFVKLLIHRVESRQLLSDDAMCQTREGSRSCIVWMIERHISLPLALVYHGWSLRFSPGAALIMMKALKKWPSKVSSQFSQTSKNPINLFSSYLPMCWAVQSLHDHENFVLASLLFEVNVKLKYHALDKFIDLLYEVFQVSVQRFNDQFEACWLNCFFSAKSPMNDKNFEVQRSRKWRICS